MKKIVVTGLVILALITAVNAFAWSIVKTENDGNNKLAHYVRCDSGRIVVVVEATDINRYFVGGVMYSSMSEAVNSNCN